MSNTKMFGFNVKINKYQEHYESDSQPYGSWSASSHHEIDSIIFKTDDYPDVTAPFDFNMGDTAFVVWAQWSSGDSFGNESGASAEAIGVFKDAKAAFELKNHIDSVNWRKENTLDFKTSDGQHFKMGWCGWSGYFESLDFIAIETVLVNDKL